VELAKAFPKHFGPLPAHEHPYDDFRAAFDLVWKYRQDVLERVCDTVLDFSPEAMVARTGDNPDFSSAGSILGPSLDRAFAVLRETPLPEGAGTIDVRKSVKMTLFLLDHIDALSTQMAGLREDYAEQLSENNRLRQPLAGSPFRSAWRWGKKIRKPSDAHDDHTGGGSQG
jgi:hypothetical protein